MDGWHMLCRTIIDGAFDAGGVLYCVSCGGLDAGEGAIGLREIVGL